MSETVDSPSKYKSTMLVTNTMICQAGMLVDGHPSRMPFSHKLVGEQTRGDLARFFDLASLIEAVILHNKLVTLDGILVGQAELYDSLSLREGLKKHGVIDEKAIPFNQSDAQRHLANIVGPDRIFNWIRLSGLPVRIPEMLPDVFPSDSRIQGPSCNPNADRHEFYYAINEPKLEKDLTNSQHIFEFFRGPDFEQYLQGTGEYGRGSYILRTFLYQNAANNVNTPFYPDYPRIPFLKSYYSYFRSSIITKVYKFFAEKLEAEAEEFLQDKEPIGLIIPPFTAILLERCQSPQDICTELLNLRDEYSGLRKHLSELEEHRLQCTNIYERNQFREEVKNIFEAATRKMNGADRITLESSAKLAEDILNPVYNPLDPTAYASSLLVKPIEWIRDYWYRRPITQFFDVTDKFRKIDQYNSLVEKVFGISFSDNEKQSFKYTLRVLNNMFNQT